MVNVLCSLFIFAVFGQTPQPSPPSPQTSPPLAQTGTSAVPLVNKVEKKEEIEISQIQSFLSPFIYEKGKFRDPFEAQGGSSPLRPGEVYGPFLELQNYRLSEFELKGLLWKTNRPVAVFKAPNGEEYRLGVKDYIGENFGYIATIREKEVVIIQTIEEKNKRYSTTKVVFLESKKL